MNRIFFLNKGHTKNRPVPKLPGRTPSTVPIEFYGEPGLTLILNPTLIRQSFFACEFFVIVNSTAKMVQYMPGREYMDYTCILSGAYNKYNNGFLRTESSCQIRHRPLAEQELYVGEQKDAISLVYEGIAEFNKYFMPDVEGQNI